MQTYRATTLEGRVFPASRANDRAPLIDATTDQEVSREECIGCLLQPVNATQFGMLVADADFAAEQADMSAKAARLAKLTGN